MVRKFEVGGVYNCWCWWPIAIKVTRISADREFVWFREFGKEERQRKIVHEPISVHESISRETARIARGGFIIRASGFHRLHPFFPTDVYRRNMDMEPFPDGEIAKRPLAVRRFHEKIMKTFVLFFFSVKLIVIARRVKERMYAPGGIGFIAAQEDFDRVTKSQRIE